MQDDLGLTLTKRLDRNQRKLTDARLEAICGEASRRICAPYKSPHLEEEAFEDALVAAHLCRAEGMDEALLVFRVNRSVITTLQGLCGRSRTAPGEYKVNYKLPVLFTDSLTVTDGAGQERDNPQLPRQRCQYEQADDRIFAAYLLSTLNTRWRDILTMRYWDDMTDAEIGRKYGVDRTSIGRTIQRVLRRLRALPEVQEAMNLI